MAKDYQGKHRAKGGESYTTTSHKHVQKGSRDAIAAVKKLKQINAQSDAKRDSLIRKLFGGK